MTWDEDDRLRSTTRAATSGGTPAGHVLRLRRRRPAGPQGHRPAGPAGRAVRKSERIYLGGIEIYREYAADGTTVTLERETLHVTDGDTARRAGRDPHARAPTRRSAQLVRYQHANHLGSAVLELDDQAHIISYEEYFPYGSTSYQAVASQTESAQTLPLHRKRTRRGKRPLLPRRALLRAWLGRWTSATRRATQDGLNLYAYARGNPVRITDPDGRQSADSGDDAKKSRCSAARGARQRHARGRCPARGVDRKIQGRIPAMRKLTACW